MRSFLGLLRAVAALFILTLAPSLLLAAFFAVWDAFYWGLLLGFLASASLLAWVGFASDKILVTLHQGTPASASLVRSMARALEGRHSRITPAIFVIGSPVPNLLVARAFLGKGTVMVTHGALALLDEAELRDALQRAHDRCQESPLAWDSLFSCLSCLVFRNVPSTQVLMGLLNGTGRESIEHSESELHPLNMVFALALWFPLRLLGAQPRHPQNGTAFAAMHKIRKASTQRPFAGEPGTECLHLV